MRGWRRCPCIRTDLFFIGVLGLGPLAEFVRYVNSFSAVLYHYPCPDGAFAALAAHLYFAHSPAATAPPSLFFSNTVYSPLRAEDLPLNEIDNVYLVDFAGPPGFIQQLSPKDERSGATIAYDYFKERLLAGDNNGSKNVALAELQRVRRLFEYIEDVDLWRWRLPNSKAFSSGMKDLNLEFDVTSNPTMFQHVASVQHILHKIGSNM
ncbi:hypothetical protein ACS0TY_008794 [Phlomoides rotata]